MVPIPWSARSQFPHATWIMIAAQRYKPCIFFVTGFLDVNQGSANASRLPIFPKGFIERRGVVTNGTSADIQALQTDIKQLRTDFAGLGETVRDLVRHGGEEAKAKALESGDKVWKEAKHHAQTIGHEIEERPVTSALAAFGVGMILGILFSGRRR